MTEEQKERFLARFSRNYLREEAAEEAGEEGAVGGVVAEAVGVFAEEAAEVRVHGGNAPGGRPAR